MKQLQFIKVAFGDMDHTTYTIYNYNLGLSPVKDTKHGLSDQKKW